MSMFLLGKGKTQSWIGGCEKQAPHGGLGRQFSRKLMALGAKVVV